MIGKKVKPDKQFSKRLERFNIKIKYLVDCDYSYEKWLGKFYSSNALGPNGWISKGRIQMDQYIWMIERMISLHNFVHLEDVDLIREIWGS